MIEVCHPALWVSSCTQCVRSGYLNSVGLYCDTPVRLFAITGCVSAPHVHTFAGYVPVSASSVLPLVKNDSVKIRARSPVGFPVRLSMNDYDYTECTLLCSCTQSLK